MQGVQTAACILAAAAFVLTIISWPQPSRVAWQIPALLLALSELMHCIPAH